MKNYLLYLFLLSTLVPAIAQEVESEGNQQEIKAEEAAQEEKMDLKVGGALRFNYNYSSWKPNQKKRGGDFGFEVFRINVEANYRRLGLHIDQRFYATGFGGAFLKYGWFQYDLKPNSHLKLGLIPAYFGAQQFNSHSWFFQLPFYLGFEDDHDMGLSYDFENDQWQVDVGFYKNAENLSFADNAPISDARYSYDFAGRNKEVNQLNTRINYKFGTQTKHKLGVSLQYGGIWNIDTEQLGTQKALALHYELANERWSIKAQYLRYQNQAASPDSISTDWIEMTAYGAPYNTAAQASIYTIGIAYTIPVNWKPITSLQFYNNFAYMDKAVSAWEDTQMNVLGLLITAAPMYIYVDFAQGKHHPWLGPQWTNALTSGDARNGWESRFNINVGYYY